jgi:heat shock protein beta
MATKSLSGNMPLAAANMGSSRPHSSLRLIKNSLISASRPLSAAVLGPAAGSPRPEGHPRQVRLYASSTEEFTYQAEVDRLMDMIVNSLYSNREVFLRELISNASDALDKIRILALQNPSEYDSGSELEIRIKADEGAKTIVIEDTGVGMTKEELLSSLGTIARSGTAKFVEQMKEKGDASLIGQFGVGFYSAFLVADKVTVQTKSNGDSKQYKWESSAGSHQYSITEEDARDIARGTRITLHLKDDATDIGNSTKLSALIKQYSEFISFPIKLWADKEVPVEVVDDEATKKKQEEADEAAKKDGKDAADPVPTVMKTTWESKTDWLVQNDNKPIWTRPPRDVAKDEYASFFKSTFREFLDPLDQIHFNVEGTIEFSSLLFIPAMAPFDQQEAMRKSKNIRLYVKRVFISDEFDEDLMPRYLNFVKGVVDSADLPLNVSREILQESRVVRAIRKQLIKRTLDAITSMAENEESKENYTTFWEAFGRNIKLGVLEDEGNRQVLAKLLRFESSVGSMTSLMDYVGRKKDEQTCIYFLTADNKAAAEASPYVEQLTSKGFEVLYLTEPIDEIAMANLAEFEGMQLVDVTKEDLSLGQTEEDKKALEEASKSLEGLTDLMKSVLGDSIEKVTVTNRLTDTPAVVVASKFGWSANMERIMKAQAMADQQAAEYMKGRRSMEINPNHPIIKALAENLSDDKSKDKIQLLYEAALLTGGFPLESPKQFADRIYQVML